MILLQKIKSIELENFNAGLLYIEKRIIGLFYIIRIFQKRQLNFSLAHELGHYFMHRKLTNKQANNPIHHAQLEKEADLFAVSLLRI